MAGYRKEQIIAICLIVTGSAIFLAFSLWLWSSPADTFERLDNFSIKVMLVFTIALLILNAGLVLFNILYDPPVRRYCRTIATTILGAGFVTAAAPTALKSAQVDLFNEVEGAPQIQFELMTAAKTSSLDILPTMVAGWMGCLIIYFLCAALKIEQDE